MSQVIITLSNFMERGLLSQHFREAGYDPILFSAHSGCEDRRTLTRLLKETDNPRFVVASAVSVDGDDEFAVKIQDELLRASSPSLLAVYASNVGKGKTYVERQVQRNPQERHSVLFLKKTPFDDLTNGSLLGATEENLEEFNFLVHRASVWFANYGERKPA
jgi:hypothetical protein